MLHYIAFEFAWHSRWRVSLTYYVKRQKSNRRCSPPRSSLHPRCVVYNESCIRITFFRYVGIVFRTKTAFVLHYAGIVLHWCHIRVTLTSSCLLINCHILTKAKSGEFSVNFFNFNDCAISRKTVISPRAPLFFSWVFVNSSHKFICYPLCYLI